MRMRGNDVCRGEERRGDEKKWEGGMEGRIEGEREGERDGGSNGCE